jgi:Tfp pilus assembly protein PilV
MRKFTIRKHRRNPQAGLTMLEVLFAAVVLTIGFMGLIGLVATAIASNNRNKLDSTGTMLTQAVVEQINSTIVGSGTATLSDCAGNTWNIGTAIGGAALSGANMDFTQSLVPTSYKMNYVVCNGSQQTKYDVRWRVQQISSDNYLVTVGARMMGSGNGGNRYFALPVTLRTFVAPQ